MYKWHVYLFFIISLFHLAPVRAQTRSTLSFRVVPLGVKGGLDESNLSAYMIAGRNRNEYVCADAGTLYSGIEKAIKNKVFTTPESAVLRKYIKGYLISHGHLDHIAGLIINSPDDTAKNIYAMPYVIDVLRDKYFTWQSWANFGSEGDKPVLNKYHYVPLLEDTDTLITNTSLHVRAFSLSHSAPYLSTAFLITEGSAGILYLGDTGADEMEKSRKLENLWEKVAPLIKSHHLKAIMIEVSFPDEQPDSQLFGHLTPHLLMNEMSTLARLTGSKALINFPIVVTHIKPTAKNEQKIKAQLKKANRLQLKLVYPSQGVAMEF